AAMYQLLAAPAKQRIAEDRFVARYQAIADEATIQGIAYQLDPGAGANNAGPIPFSIEYQTALWGPVRSNNSLPVVQEDGWKVDWAPTVIFPDLTGDNLVRFLPKPARRGTILDRAGRPLTVDAFAMEVGVVPGKLQDKENTVAYLANALQMKPETVREK